MFVYLILINAFASVLMLADKIRAKKKLWRLPETVLLGVAVIGGSVGSILGMYLFWHKTRHLKFAVGLPVILALQIIACIILL